MGIGSCSRSVLCAAAVDERLLDVDGLAVRIVRKRIKNVNLRIKPPAGDVVISAPVRVPDAEIKSLVRSKRAWIDAKRREVAQAPSAVAAQASSESEASWRAIVEACVPVLVERWEAVLGVKAGKLAYRNMTSRWGSCQPATGRICINTRLALYPPSCLEYVVVHELCHLIERGHGPRFKALLDAVMPDWRDRRNELR